MSKLEMVARVPDDQQHGADAEGVKAVKDKFFSCADDGKVKYVRPKILFSSMPESDMEAVILHGDKVLACADSGKVKVFDHNLNLLNELKAHDYAVYDIIVVGDTLFTCSIDSTIKTWDVNTFEHRKTIDTPEDAVRKFTTNGKLIFAGDEKGDVRGFTPEGELSVFYNVVEEVWDLYMKDDLLYSVRDRGITITELKGEDNKYIHCMSLDGRAPIYGTNDLLVYPDSSGLDLEVCENSKESRFKHKGTLKGTEMIITAVGGYGNLVVSGGWDGELRLWDVTKMAETGKVKLPGTPSGIAMTEKGDVFVVGADGYICKLKASS